MSTRSIPHSAFRDDDGRADARLTAALTGFRADSGRRPEVLAALHVARVLAPVVAVPGEVETGVAGLRVDKTSDIAVPLLGGTDGRQALPVFTGLDSLARWDPTARPVPVAGPRAAEVAAAEGADVMVLDPAGPITCALEAAELRALVAGRGVTPAYDDEELAAEVAVLLQGEPSVTAAWLLPAVGVDVRLAVRLTPGDGPDEGSDALRRVAERLGDLPSWADHAVRGLDIAVLPSGATPGRPPVFQRFPAGRGLR